MAGGYLGKISAVISANTGDYIRGLNESAKKTAEFSNTVQKTLRAASQDAAKSFQNIYTPFQQFERALRDASRLRLNFAGFEGAVKTVTDLKRRLDETLTKRELDLIVSTSGLKDIQEIKNVIGSITEKDIKLSVSAGGLAGLQKLRAELDASGRDSTVLVDTKLSSDRLDELIAKFSRIGDRQIDLIIDIVNERGLQDAVTQARRLQEVASDIAAPLAASAAEFGKLSQAAQGQFAPALGAVQGAVERFKADIASLGPAGSRAFADLKADVDLVSASIARLSEAQSLTSKLFTGRELTFINPGVVDELNRLQAAQQKLAAAPAGVRGSPIGREVIADAQVLKEQLDRVLARIERIRAQGGDITFSQRGLDVILQRLRQVSEETERVATPPAPLVDTARFSVSSPATQRRGLGLFGAQAGDETERAIARARAASAEFEKLGESSQAGLAGLAGIAARVADGVEAGTSNAAALEAILDRLIPKIKQASQTEGAMFGPPSSGVLNQPPPPPGLSSRYDPIARAAREGENLSRVVRDIGDTPIGGVLLNQLEQLSRKFNDISSKARLTKKDISSLASIDREREAIGAALQGRRDATREFLSGAGGIGRAGIDLKIDQKALQGAAAQIDLIQGKLSGVSVELRQKSVAALETFRRVYARAFQDGSINTEAGIRRIELARKKVVELTAAAAGLSVGKLSRDLARVGDVARGSFGNVGLAIQQGIFAFDDFFSVTGGLDQRIRAAGNNISQLGFILGGTAGLITGVVVSAVAQLAAGVLKWTGATQSAEEKQKQLEKALEGVNSALERQRDLANEVRDAFLEIAKAQRLNAIPEQFRNDIERRRPTEELQRTQERRRQAAIESSDPVAVRNAARVAAIDEQLRTEQDATRRRDLLRQRAEADRRRIEAIGFIEGRGAQNAAAAVNFNGLDGAIRQQRDARARVAEQLARAEAQAAARPNGRAPARAEQLARELAVIDNTIQRIVDASQRLALEQGQRAGASSARAVANLADVPGIRQLDSVIAVASQRLEGLKRSFEAGAIDFADYTKRAGAIESLLNVFEEASIAVSAFSKAVDDAASSLANTVEQELRQRSDQSRRDANATEARFGRDDQRTVTARETQRRVEEARRRAADEVAAIEAERSRLRLAFEDQAGTGGLGDREQQIVSRLQEIDAALSRPAASAPEARDQERMRIESDGLRRELDGLFGQLPDIAALGRRADQIDVDAQREIQRIESEAKGRELRRTPAQRAAEDTQQRVSDIAASFGADIAAALRGGQFGDIAGIQNQQREALGRLIEDDARRAAPLIMGFRDERLNAALQGPSRAALNVADAQTMEGQKELNRLLRGDDPNKDVNLQELKEQSRLLQAVIDAIKDNADQVVEIRG